MKAAIKRILGTVPGLDRTLRRGLAELRVARMRWRCYRADIAAERAHVGWHRGETGYWKLSAELIFQHHKLEKGLCLPEGARPLFGDRPASRTLTLLRRWREAGHPVEAPVYQSSLGVLRAWRDHVAAQPDLPPGFADLMTRIERALAGQGAESLTAHATPVPARPAPPDSIGMLEALARARRSTRDFTGAPVDPALVTRAVEVAQLSPSACNRQPWKLHLYDDPADIAAMLAHQNGNRGFGHTVPLLAVLSCDLHGFFDASERVEPALDGGLFLMSLLMALQAQGLATCCLNWCVPPEVDRKGHATGNIPANEKILTFLAIGHPSPGAVVPLSARRPLADVIRRH